MRVLVIFLICFSGIASSKSSYDNYNMNMFDDFESGLLQKIAATAISTVDDKPNDSNWAEWFARLLKSVSAYMNSVDGKIATTAVVSQKFEDWHDMMIKRGKELLDYFSKFPLFKSLGTFVYGLVTNGPKVLKEFFQNVPAKELARIRDMATNWVHEFLAAPIKRRN